MKTETAGGGCGRIACCLRSITAGIFGRAKENLKVIYRRLSARPGFLIKLLNSHSLIDWEKACQPYSLR